MTTLLNILPDESVSSDDSWVREAYIAILNREPDRAGLQYFVDLLKNGTLSREQVSDSLLNSEEARTATAMGIFSVPRPGQTRYCFEPWVNLVLKADGTVYPCCSHPAVGRISAENGLDAVMEGPGIRTLRHALLAGRLDPYCAHCRNQPSVDTEHFRRDFALKFFLNGKTMNEAGYVDLRRHPEVLRNIRFAGAAESCYGLGSRIFLQPTRECPAPAVTFGGIQCDRPQMLHVHLDLDAPDSAVVVFRLGIAGGQEAAVETRLSGKQSAELAISCTPAGAPIDITYSVRALGAGTAHALAYFSYPFFDGM